MSMDHFALWQRTLAKQSDEFDPQREILRQAFLSFRNRAAQLVGEIGRLLPDLTVHDISHLDALWRIADEIAGPTYPLNAAEAFVLGGAFLLHDAAHVLAAYEGGLDGIKASVEWKDLIAQRFENEMPTAGSPQERSALFQVLRHLHAKQAHHLAKASWKMPGTKDKLHLLENLELRECYGDLIGEIAASHHWPAYRVADVFEHRYVNPPSFLAPADWVVDALKVAFILRTADAAHIDGQRAPWFLFALRHPDGISHLHWKFQAKMSQPKRTSRSELRLSSGSPFEVRDRQAWWLAYESACMIDRELRAANILMRDSERAPLAINSVEHITTPEAFAINVRTLGWEPINVTPKISDVPKIIANLGGTALYGDRPELALRELLQNAADAVRALRALEGIGQTEGEIEVALERGEGVTWLHVKDTGIGMSRYVLTEVLLDFGNSLWGSESLRTELPGLASNGFKAVGQFGIGFFSIFMLGSKVVVTTRRFKQASGNDDGQWLLEFDNGLNERPALRKPLAAEELRRSGTRVSVAVNDETLVKLLDLTDSVEDLFSSIIVRFRVSSTEIVDQSKRSAQFKIAVANLCPTLDIKVRVKIDDEESIVVINPDDWKTLAPFPLLTRLHPRFRTANQQQLVELREPSGFLVGRVGYRGAYQAHAVITHRGLNSGSLPSLAGVVLGHNNMDLARNDSLPMASQEAWKLWAEKWINLCTNDNFDALANLHALCPEKDLPIFRLGDNQYTAARLIEWLRTQKEIRVFDEAPEYDENDEVSKDNFERYFYPKKDILFLPSIEGRLAKALKFPKIDYALRLEKYLRLAWGDFEEWIIDEEPIGKVANVDIERSITLYEKD